jgi:hypothetical protein
MNPATAAALLSRGAPIVDNVNSREPEQPPKPAVGPELVAAAGGPEALQELVRQEKLRREQEAAVAAPEATPAPAIEPPTYEALRDLVATRGGIAALRAMARAQAMQPRPKPQKPKPVTFQPTDPAIVAERVALALEALDGLELDPPKGVTCHQRRWANKVGYALGAARRELERAKALAEDRPA